MIRLRGILLGLLLAVPALFLTRETSFSLHSTYYEFGWPLAIGEIHFWKGEDPIKLSVSPEWTAPFEIVLTLVFARLLWRVWAIVRKRPALPDAFVQALLTTLYLFLCACFIQGAIEIVWYWRMLQVAKAADLAVAHRWGAGWLPYACSAGLAVALCLLFLDSLVRVGIQRLWHVAFALGLCAMTWGYVTWEVKQLDDSAVRLDQISRERSRGR